MKQQIPVQRVADHNTSDGYHTFDELYDYRMLYNALAFTVINSVTEFAGTQNIPGLDLHIHKSWLHSDGKPCFGGGWFIVMANLPTGQISNHYEAKYWDLFNVPECEVADEWDGHTPEQAAERLRSWLMVMGGPKR